MHVLSAKLISSREANIALNENVVVKDHHKGAIVLSLVSCSVAAQVCTQREQCLGREFTAWVSRL
eukprot:m.36097 g.36097  ORF g.36097 m.36097 type:complete len:65 (-) comp12832_c0_seq2:985-1179(-)